MHCKGRKQRQNKCSLVFPVNDAYGRDNGESWCRVPVNRNMKTRPPGAVHSHFSEICSGYNSAKIRKAISLYHLYYLLVTGNFRPIEDRITTNGVPSFTAYVFADC